MSLFPNWSKNILFLIVYTLSGLVLVIVIEGLLTGTALIPFNTAIERIMADIRTPIFTTIVVAVTNFGSPFILSALAGFIIILLLLRGDRYDAALFFAAMIVAYISFTVLKNIFQVPRPNSALFQADGWSFPSGHATLATTFFFLLAHSFFRKMSTVTGKITFVSGCILGTALVCLSRLYLGAHWALDILAGVALGLLSVSFVVLIFSMLLDNVRWLRRRDNL